MSAIPTDPPRRAFAIYDAHGVPHSEFKRICLRCKRPMLGHSYKTVYGVFVDWDGTRIPAGGKPLHDVCPGPDAKPRAAQHNADEFWGQAKKPTRRHTHRTEKTVETGIILQSNGRYSVRVKHRRIGTYETIEQARAERDRVIKPKGQNTYGQRQKRK